VNVQRFPRDGRIYEPAFFLTGEKPKPGENPRKALGRILPTHIQFARAAVNIVWQKLMVVGLVEPYDGFDLKRLDPKNPPPAPWTIQPSNPELLEALAQDFRANNYSIQHVIKTIMKSNAYQLSTSFGDAWKPTYVPYYARRFARVLTGPEAVDIVAEATDSPYKIQLYGQPKQYVKELTNPLSMKGGLLHLINHSFTKSLLFLAVGAISCATGTKKISVLSGLSKKMPITSAAFVIGGLAISGVPPFNIFWSKFFIIAGAFQLGNTWGITMGALVCVESVAGFAWFLHVIHKVFFGPISPAAENAADPPLTMLIPLLVLIVLCVISPYITLPLIDQVIGGWPK
jgi:hypothetical protein